MRNTTYFYDSDLYGGSVGHIASSIVVSGDMNELEKFCKLWCNLIDEAKDDRQRMDVFIHLLIDLNQSLRDKKNLQVKLVISDNFFMDFLFFLSIFSTKEVNIVTSIDIQHEYARWIERRFSQQLVKVENLNDLKILGDLFAHGYEGCESIKETILCHKYQKSDLAMLQESYSPLVCKYAENRIPIFFKMLKSVVDKVFVPNSENLVGFYNLYNKIAHDENEKELAFTTPSDNSALFKLLSFLVRNINDVMYEFVSKDIGDWEQYCKHSLVLVWGLWLGTALEISMIPLGWYAKYRSLLDDMFGEGAG